MTRRQYLAWQARLSEAWNRPSRTDWYLMQIDARVKSLFAKAPYTAAESKLKFTSEQQLMSVEEETEIAKAVISARLGVEIP